MNYNHVTLSGVLPRTLIYHNTNKEKEFVEEALVKIGSRYNGGLLMSELRKVLMGDKELKIKVDQTQPTKSEPYLSQSVLDRNRIPDNPGSGHYQAMLDQNIHYLQITGGPGASTKITFNPNESRELDQNGIGTRVTNHQLSFVSLAHELVHAFYTAKGERIRQDPTDPYKDLEEDRAIGIMDFSGRQISENGIRKEHNLPLRSTRFDQNEVKGLAKKYLNMVTIER